METIMIVDDNDDLRYLFRIMLQKHYKIVEASNGLEAIQLFQNHKPDLTLMDIVMPGMNGIVATREIRKLDPEARIIALTAHSTMIQDIREAGAILICQKPIRRNDLLKLVQNGI